MLACCYVQGLNVQKETSSLQMMQVVTNLAIYLDYIALETASPSWSNILVQLDIFFRRLPAFLPNQCEIAPVLKIIISTLKIPGLIAVKVRLLL